jgi:membrane protease YdiL (CAAX protease family)
VTDIEPGEVQGLTEPPPVPREPVGAVAGPAPEGNSGVDRWVSLTVLAAGAAVVSFLTWYINRPWSVAAWGAVRVPRTWDEYLVVNLIGLLFVPALVAALAPGGASCFGVANPAPGSARIALILYASMLPLLAWASFQPSFRGYYPMQHQAAYSWHYFVYFELSYGLYMLAWEWFYRGFLTFGLARGFGWAAAIGIQAAAFGLMHYGKPAPEFAGSFVAGVALGALAYRARSFVPCFWLHWAVSVTFDVLAVHSRPGGIF